jgi:hypothetical protein
LVRMRFTGSIPVVGSKFMYASFQVIFLCFNKMEKGK